MQKRRVAVFDVDGTIFRSSLFISLIEELIASGLFPKEARAQYEKEEKRFLDREGDYEAYIEAMVRSYRKHLKGVHYGAFRDAAERVVEREWRRTYRYTRDLVKHLKDRGYFLLAISHSPKTILDLFCPRLGFDKVYGKVYELGPEDRFTGAVLDEHVIANKANVLRRAVEKENLSLTHSIGVGDTESDISFLEEVEEPICFNPNKRLYRVAKRNKWNIVVERKDMIYEI